MINQFFNHFVCYIVALILSVCFTSCIIRFLTSVGFRDIPNDRSMHKAPVATSGGIAIVLSYIIVVYWSQFDFSRAWPWIITSLGFAMIGAADDFKSRAVSTRLMLQFSFALLLAGWVVSDFNIVTREISWFEICVLTSVFVALVVVLVGFINLFNFMDGSDGFAGVQALIYFLLHAYLFFTIDDFEMIAIALILSGAVSGFLFFNWHPARIFMGDSGSYFLGFQCVAVGYFSWERGFGVFPSLILASPFICDSVLTLAHRVVTGRRWWEPHRCHSYQILITKGFSARELIFALISLHLFCTLPLFSLVLIYPAFSLVITTFAFGVVGFICYYSRK